MKKNQPHWDEMDKKFPKGFILNKKSKSKALLKAKKK